MMQFLNKRNQKHLNEIVWMVFVLVVKVVVTTGYNLKKRIKVMYTAIQVAGEDVHGDCMFAIKKNGKFTGTSIAAQTREKAIQNYKKFLE